MAKKKPVAPTTEPYHLNPHIFVEYELPFGNDLIVPGDNIRIRNSRGTYRFYKVVTNMKLDKTWVDCMCNETGEYKSFYVEQIKLVIRPKKSRRKKQGVIN